MDDRIIVGEFSNRHELGIATGLLEEKKIEFMISGDDSGGIRPSLTFANPFKLLVNKQNFNEAKMILSILD